MKRLRPPVPSGIPIPAPVLAAFQKDLTAWYARHRRDLPWRRHPSPYAVAVSEFMCQQTQIAAVLPYFDRWIKRFPDWSALARAKESEVLKMWEGLGYYRRARLLHHLAQAVDATPEKELPASPEKLKEFPGIGPYTAGAIASIAFGLRAPIVDGNVERVLTRVFAVPENAALPSTRQKLWHLAEGLLPEKGCGDFNQALMECGALVCTPRSPQCLFCPLKSACQARKLDPEGFPVKSRPEITAEEETIAIVRQEKSIWMLPPGSPGRWKDFHKLPLLDLKTMEAGEAAGSIRYSITRYRVSATARNATLKEDARAEGVWLKESELNFVSLPAPHRKLLNKILSV